MGRCRCRVQEGSCSDLIHTIGRALRTGDRVLTRATKQLETGEPESGTEACLDAAQLAVVGDETRESSRVDVSHFEDDFIILSFRN